MTDIAAAHLTARSQEYLYGLECAVLPAAVLNAFEMCFRRSPNHGLLELSVRQAVDTTCLKLPASGAIYPENMTHILPITQLS
jgi:hypothetical protein